MATNTSTMAPTNAIVRLTDHGLSGSALPTRHAPQRYRAVAPPMSTLGVNAMAVAPRLLEMLGSATSANKESDVPITASRACRPARWIASYDPDSSSLFGSVASSAGEGGRVWVVNRPMRMNAAAENATAWVASTAAFEAAGKIWVPTGSECSNPMAASPEARTRWRMR